MCGIIGFVGNEQAAPIVLEGLRTLEYRGYDSAGLASVNDALHCRKDVGRIDEIERMLQLSALPGNAAIAHTRWATHGGATRENAHPHVDCANKVAVVHNGIIENYQELRNLLKTHGHVFSSETDTEVIPHLIEDYLKEGATFQESMRMTGHRLKGSFAFIAVSVDEPTRLFAIAKDNPLIIGTSRRGAYATSDVLSLQDCEQMYTLENGDMVVMDTARVAFFNLKGEEVQKNTVDLCSDNQVCTKDKFDYYMLKEIMEEPKSIRAATIQDEKAFTRIAMDILRADQVVITACGSSRYAALVGRYLFSDIAKKFCDVVMASEFEYFSESINKNTLVIAVSQSGETADVIEGVKRAKANGAQIVSIVNRYGSLLTRMSDEVIYLGCGPEVAVAATKSLISQLTVFYLLAFAMRNEFYTAVKDLKNVAAKVGKSLNGRNGVTIRKIAQTFKDSVDFYYIARGMNFPMASEAALKLKEISYIHAEGLPSGELKHGTLALIENRTPVVVICPDDDTSCATLGNCMEAKSRGAYIIGVSNINNELYDAWLKIPSVEKDLYPLACIAPLHLLAYYLALERGKDPDKPRNLAKSVTVK